MHITSIKWKAPTISVIHRAPHHLHVTYPRTGDTLGVNMHSWFDLLVRHYEYSMTSGVGRDRLLYWHRHSLGQTGCDNRHTRP